MTSYKIKVADMGGLTSRSSAELVEEANHHKCNIKLKLENGEECEGEDEEKAAEGFDKLCQEYSF